MKFLTYIAVTCFFIISLQTRAQSQERITIKDNVITALRALDLDDSVEIIEVHHSHVIAKFRVRSDGTEDTRLFDTILRSRQEKKKEWMHDNTVLSRLWGNGTESYRQYGNNSLQVVFYCQQGKVVKIKLDVDRFPPGTGLMVSAKHGLLELLPNKVFGKNTNQTTMARSLHHKFVRNQ